VNHCKINWKRKFSVGVRVNESNLARLVPSLKSLNPKVRKPRTYKQSRTSTMVQGEGGVDENPDLRFLLCDNISKILYHW